MQELEFRRVHRSIEDGLRRYGLGAGTLAFFILWNVAVLVQLGTTWGLVVGGVPTVVGLKLLAGRPPWWLAYAAIYFLRGRSALPAGAPGDPKAKVLLEELHRKTASDAGRGETEDGRC